MASAIGLRYPAVLPCFRRWRRSSSLLAIFTGRGAKGSYLPTAAPLPVKKSIGKIAKAIQDRFAFILAKACRTSPEKYSVPSAHTGPSPPSSSARATPASMLSTASAVQP